VSDLTSPATLTPSAPNRRQMVTAGLASVVGFGFDLFDLFILLYVASTVGPLFFPTSSPTLTLSATFASFGVSLVMRPLGGAVFGRFADRRGRRRTLIVTVSGVGAATALMGALPTFAAVGALARTWPLCRCSCWLCRGSGRGTSGRCSGTGCC
jgi:MFS transporter, MHS family, proline/betaine transporter